jgi:regulator of RNase E activity RraA
VVVIPKDLTVEVLLKTEENVAHEFNMRAELARGVSVSNVYRRHGKL